MMFQFLLLVILASSSITWVTAGHSSHLCDQLCDQQLHLFNTALLHKEKWALKMFNSWATIQSGWFENNFYSFGHFSECQNYRNSIPGHGLLKGQYCLVDFISRQKNWTSEHSKNNSTSRNRKRTLSQGLCVPFTCSNLKVTAFANSFFKSTEIVAIKSECQPSERPHLDLLDLGAIIVFLTFGLLLVLSTMYDIRKKDVSGEPHKLCVFSLHTNVPKLLNNSDPKSAISCVLGLRGISVLWALFGQRYTTQTALPTTNANEFTKHLNFVLSVIVLNRDISVDTFFTVGALATSMSTLATLDATKNMNFPKMIVQRYIKTTPAVAAIVLYSASLSRFTVSGPLEINDKFPLTINTLNKRCQQFWWPALLHIQNFVNPSEMCGDHTWFASLDFQLFVISLFLIYPAWKFGWKFLWSLIALAVLSCFYVFKVLLSNENDVEFLTIWTKVAAIARLGPTLVGIVLGYTIHNARKNKLNVVSSVHIVLWILSLGLLVSALVLTKSFSLSSIETFPIATAVFISLRRSIWAFGVALMIFAIEVFETGGFIRWFLTLQQWHLLRTLGICMYYVNFVYQMTIVSNMTYVATLEVWPMLHAFCGDVVVAFLLGSMLHLTFEAPAVLISGFLDRKQNEKL